MKVLFFALAAGVAAETYSSSSGFVKVHEALNSVQLSGGHRAMGLAAASKTMVEHFLKESGKSGKLNPPEVDMINNQVIPLLDEILAYLVNEKTADDTELESLHDAISNCEYQLAQDEAAEAAATEALQNHTDCRVVEAGLYAADVTHCSNFDSWLATVENSMSSHCAYPPKTGSPPAYERDSISGFESLLASGITHIGTLQGTFVTKRGQCDTAAGNLHTQHVACDGMQATAETFWCQWAEQRTTRCAQQTSCYNTAKQAYLDRYAELEPLADVRVNDAATVHYVKCLVEELATTNETDMDTWLGVCEHHRNISANDYQATYGIVSESIPDADACDDTEPEPTPSDDNWATARYQCPVGVAHCNDVMPQGSTMSCPSTGGDGGDV